MLSSVAYVAIANDETVPSEFRFKALLGIDAELDSEEILEILQSILRSPNQDPSTNLEIADYLYEEILKTELARQAYADISAKAPTHPDCYWAWDATLKLAKLYPDDRSLAVASFLRIMNDSDMRQEKYKGWSAMAVIVYSDDESEKRQALNFFLSKQADKVEVSAILQDLELDAEQKRAAYRWILDNTPEAYRTFKKDVEKQMKEDLVPQLGYHRVIKFEE